MFGKKKRVVISLQVVEDECIGCKQCVARCRRRVFGMQYKETGNHATVVHIDNCVGCGKCLHVCPSEAIKLICA